MENSEYIKTFNQFLVHNLLPKVKNVHCSYLKVSNKGLIHFTYFFKSTEIHACLHKVSVCVIQL
jgi:hypothetical protein